MPQTEINKQAYEMLKDFIISNRELLENKEIDLSGEDVYPAYIHAITINDQEFINILESFGADSLTALINTTIERNLENFLLLVNYLKYFEDSIQLILENDWWEALKAISQISKININEIYAKSIQFNSNECKKKIKIGSLDLNEALKYATRNKMLKAMDAIIEEHNDAEEALKTIVAMKWLQGLKDVIKKIEQFKNIHIDLIESFGYPETLIMAIESDWDQGILILEKQLNGDLSEALLLCCSDEKIINYYKLVHRGANIHRALYLAAKYSRSDETKFLLKSGADGPNTLKLLKNEGDEDSYEFLKYELETNTNENIEDIYEESNQGPDFTFGGNMGIGDLPFNLFADKELVKGLEAYYKKQNDKNVENDENDENQNPLQQNNSTTESFAQETAAATEDLAISENTTFTVFQNLRDGWWTNRVLPEEREDFGQFLMNEREWQEIQENFLVIDLETRISSSKTSKKRTRQEGDDPNPNPLKYLKIDDKDLDGNSFYQNKANSSHNLYLSLQNIKINTKYLGLDPNNNEVTIAEDVLQFLKDLTPNEIPLLLANETENQMDIAPIHLPRFDDVLKSDDI